LANERQCCNAEIRGAGIALPSPAQIREVRMSVAKVIEIISTSTKSFEDAVKQGVSRASQTISGVTGAWVKVQSVEVSKGKITEYRVILKVTFILKGGKGD
jgi:flavin-binding protein dodecin